MIFPSIQEVWKWPEWQAFARRAHIDIDRPTRFIQITIANDQAMEVKHEYLVDQEGSP